MKGIKLLIIGSLTIAVVILLAPVTQAVGYCDPGDQNTQYKKIYCSLGFDNNEKNDSKVLKIVSKQFDLDEDVVNGILSGTVCETIKEFNTKKLNNVPEKVKNACPSSNTTIDQKLQAQNHFVDIRNAYNKEKVMLLNSMALEYKFKVSEGYWDGKIAAVDIGVGDPPFDLIVDLNLIEKILFGSQAAWLDDIYKFPDRDDEAEDDEDVPVDIPKGEEGRADENIELPDDGGLFLDNEGKEVPPNCVPPDDPNADPKAGEDESNILCGDGNLDILFGEECDDGNKETGDGCNQYCQIELAGSNVMCMDPDAITFREPMENEDGDGGDGGDNECPDGYVPKIPDVAGEGAGSTPKVPQKDGYPGPSIGGTLKQFPESTRPECPSGYVGVGAGAGGEETLGLTVAGKQYDIPRCLPTELCTDFDAARDFLFGEDWKDNPTTADVAGSIELLFCANVIKYNRPYSPYSLIEGCIDCNITAMVDSLEEALTTNVSPLENTTSSFGLSSKFGPNFSFNLMTATKKKLRFKNTGTIAKKLQNTNQEFGDEIRKNTPKETPINRPETASETITRRKAEDQRRRDAIAETAKIYNWSSGAISDIEMGARVKPLLIQMQSSFSNIQAKFEGVIASTALDEKKACKP